MIRKIALYFALMVGVMAILAWRDDDFVFHPWRALIAVALLPLAAFAIWLHYDSHKDRQQDEP